MRVLLIGPNYPPESVAGPYTADLALYLIRRGHDVAVSTGFPYAPQWKIWEGYRGRFLMREVIGGVPVKRTYLYVPKDPRKALQRVLFDMSFAVSALLGNLSPRPVDLIVVISPPLQIGLTGWLLGVLKRAPVFLHIKDLVPDAAVAVGALNEKGWPVRLARRLERFVYRRVSGIGVISPGFRSNLVAKGVPSKKIAIFPDYIDPEFVRPGPLMNGFRTTHAIAPGAFVAMYSGSVSGKQGLETFIEAAAQLRSDQDIVFYLIGEGPYLAELKAMQAAMGLRNLHFLPLQPREAMGSQFAAANALVVTQKKTVTDMVFPNKLLFYMAAERPIVAAVSPQSETGRFITEHRVGLVVPPENPPALAEAIRQLKRDSDGARQMGEKARQVCIRHFNREMVLAQFADHLENLALRPSAVHNN